MPPGGNHNQLNQSQQPKIEEHLKAVHALPYYHGLRSRSAVEEVLKEKGDYLVRCIKNKQTDSMVLSICLGADAQPPYAHLSIEYKNKQWEVSYIWKRPGQPGQKSKASNRSIHEAIGGGQTGSVANKRSAMAFETIEAFVKFYKARPISNVNVMLKNPIRRPKWLLSMSSLQITKKCLGTGHYCQVVKGGIYGKNDKKIEKIAAIKMLHDSEEEEEKNKLAEEMEKDEGRDSMFREAQIMAKCKHKHVVAFFGVQCDVPPVMIAMEYCPGGSLDVHLQKHKAAIVDGERAVYCYEAARGMRYLHYHKFIHRDLAARNCLISANGLVKISDFGLSNTIEHGSADINMKNIPLRWMAPETLNRNPVFSTKSDIWSYGVLVYEIFNLGIKPWAEEEDQKKICHMIRHGPMPDLPARTPPPMKDLIHRCWTVVPAERPDFREIVKSIFQMAKQHPNLKFPKASDFSVNDAKAGVKREADGTLTEEEALAEKSMIYIMNDEKISCVVTSEETTTRGSREATHEHDAHEGKGSKDSVEDQTRGIRMTKKTKSAKGRAVAEIRK